MRGGVRVSLCLTGTGETRVGPCADPGRAIVFVRSPVVTLNRRRPLPVRLSLFGTRIRLVCRPVGAPCVPKSCTDQADCASNGPFSRCVNGECVLTESSS